MLALDALLQVLREIMERVARKEPAFPCGRDSRRIRVCPVRADPVRCQQRLVLKHLAEETFRCVQIAFRRQQEINRIAVLVDGPVKIAPLASDPDVGLVDPDRTTMGFTEAP